MHSSRPEANIHTRDAKVKLTDRRVTVPYIGYHTCFGVVFKALPGPWQCAEGQHHMPINSAGKCLDFTKRCKVDVVATAYVAECRQAAL